MLGVAQNAQAAYVVPGVTVSSLTGATTNTSGGYKLQDMVNGKGLPGGIPSLTGNHANTASGNSWRSVLNPKYPVGITFNLNGIRELAGLSFWNANSNQSNSGVKNVTFQYSTDGTNFFALNPISFKGVAGAWTGAFDQGGAAAQLVDFKEVKATHVRFNITSNYFASGTASRIAINEVQFKAIPEPSASLALLALGLAGVGLRKRI
ncbi:MAG: discoidin domain-containing protein, partial [Microcystis aeruginosa]